MLCVPGGAEVDLYLKEDSHGSDGSPLLYRHAETVKVI